MAYTGKDEGFTYNIASAEGSHIHCTNLPSLVQEIPKPYSRDGLVQLPMVIRKAVGQGTETNLLRSPYNTKLKKFQTDHIRGGGGEETPLFFWVVYIRYYPHIYDGYFSATVYWITTKPQT